jgi:hypothetical protein
MFKGPQEEDEVVFNRIIPLMEIEEKEAKEARKNQIQI